MTDNPTMVGWMQPRDRASAGRTLLALGAIAVAVSVILTPLAPATRGLGTTSLVVAGAGLLVSLLLVVAARFAAEADWLAWTLCPLLTTAMIVLVDLATADASVSAQIFFLFPTVYGAALLPWRGAVVMTTACVVGEIVVVAVNLPARQALNDAGYVITVLVTVTVLLARSTERQARLVAQLHEQAAIDPLTGLVTRRVLDQAATSALSGAETDEGTTLVLLDVDRFKAVNDGHGHPAGDAVLRQLAGLITRRTRPVDIVCRMGGDEIAVLLPGLGAAAAHHRAQLILDDVRAHEFVVGTEETLDLTVSVGVAHAPTHATDLRELYATADAALYTAKHTGRDRVVAAPAHLTSARG